MKQSLRDNLARTVFMARLHELVAKHGVSQTALANETGISPWKISRYLLGRNEPKLADLAALCVYFNVSPEVFLDSREPLKPLTKASQAVETSAILGSVEHKLFRDLFQMLQSKLIKLKPEERRHYLQSWVQFARAVLE
jgi:transcriptional regulator with XRE-family HTH domain